MPWWFWTGLAVVGILAFLVILWAALVTGGLADDQMERWMEERRRDDP